MKVFASIWLVFAGTAVQAQDVVFDRTAVDACFEEAGISDVSPSCIGAAPEVCMDATEGGFSTAGMATCVSAEIDVWDGFLNREYQDLRAQMAEADANDFAGSVSRVDALRDTQRAWLAYRDAECGFNWAMFQEGTIRTLVAGSCRLEMTARRALELRQYRETPG